MSEAALGPLIVDVAGTTLTADDRDLLCRPGVGGVILFTRNFESRAQLIELTGEIRQTRHNLLIMADYEGGRVQRFREGFTAIPPMAALGRYHGDAPGDAVAAAADLGWLMASELGEAGIDLPLAPVADLDYGQSSVIGHRAFSDKTDAVIALTTGFISGLREGGSLATAKHFPGHGWVAADSHAELPVDMRDAEALAEDWQPFAALIDQNIASIMMAHVHYPAIDASPASLSSVWIQEILRQRLAFDGCVFCDDLSMGGAVAFGDVATRVGRALTAGCDFLPVCNDRGAALAAVDAVSDHLATGWTRREQFATRLERSRAGRVEDSARGERAQALAHRLATP